MLGLIVISLAFSCINGQLSFKNAFRAPEPALFSVGNKANGLVLNVTNGWVAADTLSKTKVTTYYVTILSDVPQGLGLTETEDDICTISELPDQVQSLVGNAAACLWSDVTTLYTEAIPDDSYTEIEDLASFNETYKFVLTPVDGCLHFELTKIGSTNTTITTGYESICKNDPEDDIWLDIADRNYSASFEALNGNSAQWCIQNEGQAALKRGNCTYEKIPDGDPNPIETGGDDGGKTTNVVVDKGGLSGGAIAGIVIGGIVFVVVIIALAVKLSSKVWARASRRAEYENVPVTQGDTPTAARSNRYAQNQV